MPPRLETAMRGLALAVALVPLAAMAEPARLGLAVGGAAAVARPAPLVELRLEDGRTAVLAGILVPEAVAGEVGAALAPLLARAEIVAASEALDRYGRLAVAAAAPDGRSLQGALLAAGLALVQPLPGADPAHLAELLAAERLAERGRRGIWRDQAAFVVGAEPAAAAARQGQFALVEGRVLQASAQQRYFYLNFGSNWRTDTTARIDKDTLRTMQRAGFDPAALEGKRVRLRGTLFAENGPMIELWTHQGTEILP
jgi:micrococcal nuclease